MVPYAWGIHPMLQYTIGSFTLVSMSSLLFLFSSSPPLYVSIVILLYLSLILLKEMEVEEKEESQKEWNGMVVDRCMQQHDSEGYATT